MKIKHIVFRADSSSKIGWGHIVRCFALAQRFKEKNYEVSFIVRPHLNHISHIFKGVIGFSWSSGLFHGFPMIPILISLTPNGCHTISIDVH